VSVRSSCPHCATPCSIASEHIGILLRCSRCGKTFTFFPEPSVPEVPPVAASRLDIGAATSPGRVRERNEDSHLIQHLVWSNLDQRHELALLVVADGMGGHEAGDLASGMVVRAVGKSLAPLFTFWPDADTDPPVVLQQALQQANQEVLQLSQEDVSYEGMGATAEVVFLRDGQAWIGHVGDCRVYHHRAGQLQQVTQDQTLVARMVELGALTPREALSHPARHEVAQAVGIRPELQPAQYRFPLQAGDWLLVACDGLAAHLEGRALEEHLRQPPSSAVELANQLVDRVNQEGGTDNCTVIAVRCV
jgi:serine/threonine protein phosphatase PrpC